MMDSLRFSVVIPVLNGGRFLEGALKSVLAQVGDDTEVLVVDGGSSDGSVEIIKRHSDKLAWWCSEADGGQSAALNKGFKMARGRHFFWLNGDDFLLPGMMERVRKHLQREPECQWIAGNLVYIDAEGKLLKCARDGAWHDWLYRSAPVRVYGPSAVFSRELFERVGGFDESLSFLMDTDLWLRFKGVGARFTRLPHYFWAFRVHEGSKTSGDLCGKSDVRMLAERERVYAKNGLRVTQWGLWQQRLWRVVNGCYVRAVWDTFRARGAWGAALPPPSRQ